MLLVGEYNHSLDAKKRVFIPAKFRDSLGDSFYITRKMNKPCLAVYSEEEMERISEKLNSFPDSEVSDIKEFFFSKTSQVTPDANGRIGLTDALLKYAGIDKNTVIIGAGNHLQVWSENAWQAQESERDMDNIRSRLAAIGL